MADEKLPEYVEKAIDRVERWCIARDSYAVLPIGWSTTDDVPPIHRYVEIRSSIAKAIREREAAALERAARVCEAVEDDEHEDHESRSTAGCLHRRIRALIHKEPANG